MSYAKMMKWNRTHPKGGKRQYMGFNPSGITAEQMDERNRVFIAEMKAKTQAERAEYWAKVKECIALELGSWHWQWIAFQRHFISFDKTVL
jgi:hypothetical protein